MNQFHHYADVMRMINMLLCTLVFAGLAWRWIGRWLVSWPLARWVVGLWATLELIVALGTAARAAIGGPFNPVQYVITVHALISLVVIAFWPKMATTRPDTQGETR